jgi:hypothetical protein
MIGEALLIILLGIAAGAAAGLFGVGGGIIFVPTLTLVLGLGQLEAEATSRSWGRGGRPAAATSGGVTPPSWGWRRWSRRSAAR